MFGGATADTLDDLEMPAVKAIEVAEGKHGMHEPGRTRVVRKVEHLHLRCVNLDVEHEAIICQLHTGRQPGVCLRMR